MPPTVPLLLRLPLAQRQLQAALLHQHQLLLLLLWLLACCPVLRCVLALSLLGGSVGWGLAPQMLWLT
jgi:hypothetical protein